MESQQADESHSKLGFKVVDLKPKAGGRSVKGSSIPLILPNDLKYNASTGGVDRVQGAQRKTLYVVPEALELLEEIVEPVSVISICGPHRTGKSYILSRLLGTADAFGLGHRMDPQTFGIWMGTKVLRGKDFTIVLLDTEGIDAAGGSADQDASILVLTILLSSQFIYNSLNVPYKGDLEKMQCFIKLAKGITVKKGERTQTSAFREFFPDFLWLLRDVSLMITDQDGIEIDPTEYLKTRVLGRWGEDDFDVSTSDIVGRAILTFFPSVECAKLERPSGDTDVMRNIAQHTDSLNPEFNKGVSELTERLLLKSRAKSGYDKGSTVSGVALSIMVKQYVEAVNDPNAIPALDNTWKNTVELLRDRTIKEVVAEYNQQMQVQLAIATNNGQDPLEESLENPNPMTWGHWRRSAARSLASGHGRLTTRYPSQPTIMDLHNELLSKVTDMLREKISHFGIGPEERSDENRHLIDHMQKRLVQGQERTVEYVAEDGTSRIQKGFVVTGGELFQYIQQNKEHSKIFCQKLFERLLDPIREHVESPPAGYNFQQLMKELALQQYHEQARGPEKWTVLQEMSQNIEELRTNFEKIDGYQRKILKEQEKTHEAELKARELAREKQELLKQAQETGGPLTIRTKPNAPTGFTGTSTATDTIDLSWTVPSNANGATFAKYKITYTTGGSSQTQEVTDPAATSTRLTGLSPGAQYTVSLVAVSAEPNPTESAEATGGPLTIRTTPSRKRTSSSTLPATVPGKKRRGPERQRRDDGAGPSGVGSGTQSTADMEIYFEKVIARVSYKWDDLARELEFSRNDIKGLRSSEPDNNHRCREVLHMWKNSKGREATLEVLRQSLINIGERQTAEDL